MRKSVDISIEYRKDGVDDEKIITIDFIPNSVLRLYYQVNEVINEVTKDSLLISELEISLQKTEDKKQQKIIFDKIKLLSDKIQKVSKSDFFEKRFKLIHKILIANKCEDEDLLNKDFWDDYIEPSEMTDFINQAVSKDNDSSKKKALIKKKSFMKTA